MKRNNDILWKSLLEEVFDDLLMFIFPDAKKVFDFRRGFEFLDNRLLEQKLMIVRMLNKKGFSEKKIVSIMVFLHNYVQFGKPEMNRIFVEEVDSILGKKNYMGIVEHLAEIRATEARKVALKEGLEEGKENASRAFVENLLRDGLYTQVKIASLANVTLAFVKKVKKGQGSK